MKKFLTTSLVLVALSPFSMGQSSRFEELTVHLAGKTYSYRLFKPEGLSKKSRVPLVLFLHGAGERGSDNKLQLRHFPGTMAGRVTQKKFRSYVLAPQCPKDQWWHGSRNADGSPVTPEALKVATAALLRTVRENKVDTNRIYLTGLSMGGYGSWEMAMRHPDWFAAVAPICGGGDPGRAHRLVGAPLWAWHGDADKTVPVTESQKMIEAIKNANGNPLYSELPGVGHYSWGAAYKPDKVVPWMFKQMHSPKNPLPGLGCILAEGVLKSGEKIAFLGDSITQSGARPGGYVNIIAKTLKKVRPDCEVIPAGISGHKVPDLQKRLDRDVINKGATLVFIYIGINDVWHSTSGRGTSKKDYESGLLDIIARLKKSGARVILASPTVIGEKTDGSNNLDKLLDQYAAISRRVAEEAGIHFYDLRGAMIDALRLKNPKGLAKGILTTDGVHLNPAGNRFLAKHACLAMREASSGN